jgi:3-phenylpropionate/trans-cinnamate dioxygenase ferredoxin subunit
MSWVDVAAESDLEPGRAIGVRAGTHFVALARCEDGVRAVEDVCTHDGAELAGGEVEGCEIACPRHGARFCLRTGAALTPPAYEAIRTYEAKVEGGRIWVRTDD